jgi:asparagine synthase (glutamine-hydrolysing)
MCGIVGIIHADPARPVAPALIRRMCEAIRHRGPYDEGVYMQGAVLEDDVNVPNAKAAR